MDLVNPFEEHIVFGKRYPVAYPPQHSTIIRALVPTGRHVGHGNDLGHFRGKGAHGGRLVGLERYTAQGGKASVGPFGKVDAPRGELVSTGRPKRGRRL